VTTVSETTFSQINEMPTEPLDRLMVLAATPAALARKGLVFHREMDDLGPYAWAAVNLDGQTFAFQAYTHSLEHGTVLWGKGDPEVLLNVLDVPDSWRPDEQPAA
jgi:hypothetical protein